MAVHGQVVEHLVQVVHLLLQLLQLLESHTHRNREGPSDGKISKERRTEHHCPVLTCLVGDEGLDPAALVGGARVVEVATVRGRGAEEADEEVERATSAAAGDVCGSSAARGPLSLPASWAPLAAEPPARSRS